MRGKKIIGEGAEQYRLDLLLKSYSGKEGTRV
jgi:hypothetical protein